jgi:hypothetical protein
MTKPHAIAGGSIIRGLGWDIQSPFPQEFQCLFPGRVFRTHQFYRHVYLEEPFSNLLIIFTSRLYPAGKGRARPLRAKVAAAIAAAVPDFGGLSQ